MSSDGSDDGFHSAARIKEIEKKKAAKKKMNGAPSGRQLSPNNTRKSDITTTSRNRINGEEAKQKEIKKDSDAAVRVKYNGVMFRSRRNVPLVDISDGENIEGEKETGGTMHSNGQTMKELKKRRTIEAAESSSSAKRRHTMIASSSNGTEERREREKEKEKEKNTSVQASRSSTNSAQQYSLPIESESRRSQGHNDGYIPHIMGSNTGRHYQDGVYRYAMPMPRMNKRNRQEEVDGERRGEAGPSSYAQLPSGSRNGADRRNEEEEREGRRGEGSTRDQAWRNEEERWEEQRREETRILGLRKNDEMEGRMMMEIEDESESSESDDSSEEVEMQMKPELLSDNEMIARCKPKPTRGRKKKRVIGSTILIQEEEEEIDAWSNEDKEVIRELTMVLRRNEEEGRESFPIRATMNAFDERALEVRMRNMSYRKDKDDKANKKKTVRLKEHKFDHLPFTTPAHYYLIGERESESHGTLPFYDAAENRPEGMTMPSIPAYTTIHESISRETHSQGVYQLEEAIVDEITCKDVCRDGCRLSTCPCMKKSSLRDGLVDVSVHKWPMIYECCAECGCGEDCPSIVKMRKIKIHVIHLANMGFGVRVMEPVERGEVIFEFTGLRQTMARREDANWAYTVANCMEVSLRLFMGIDDPTASFVVNPRVEGNASRFICHSYFPNTAWINKYRGGRSRAEPEAMVYTLEPLEAGDILYLNYGKEFGIKKELCKCTQQLCHDEKVVKWMRKLTWQQAKQMLKRREMDKRKRIQKSIQQAQRDVADWNLED